MGKTKDLAATLIRADWETMSFFIKTWSEFSPADETPKELADSVQKNFYIQCTENDVVRAFAGKIELEDQKLIMKHNNLYQ